MPYLTWGQCPSWQPRGPGAPNQHPASNRDPPCPSSIRLQQRRAWQRVVHRKAMVDFIAQAGEGVRVQPGGALAFSNTPLCSALEGMKMLVPFSRGGSPGSLVAALCPVSLVQGGEKEQLKYASQV